MLPHRFLKEIGGLVDEEREIDRTLCALGYSSSEDSQIAVVITNRPAPPFDFVATHMPYHFGMQAYVFEANLKDVEDLTQAHISANDEASGCTITVEDSAQIAVELEDGTNYLVPVAAGHIVLGELQVKTATDGAI